MKNSKAMVIIILLTLFVSVASAQKSPTEQVSAISTWNTHFKGVYISLTQILKEQAQAFYVNRGFSLEQIEAYASSCIFMAVMRNDTAPGIVHFNSNNWSVLTDGKEHSRLSVDEWLHRLSTESFETGIPEKGALVAFRWAQFPPEQEYEPGGDWNQGMLSLNLSPGSQFDLLMRWDIAGKPFKTRMTGLSCAE